VESAGVAIGLKCADGIVIGVEKLYRSKLLVEGTNRRIFTVDARMGLGFVGWEADGRPLAEVAQQECNSYRSQFGVDIPPHVLADRLGQHVHNYTCYGSHRPWGVTLLIAGYDEHDRQPYLHMVEPAGMSFRTKAGSAGKSRPAVKTEIEKLDLDKITVREGLREIARIIRVVHEDEKEFELECSWICADSQWRHVHVPKDVRLQAEAWAKQKVEEAEMGGGEMHVEGQ
jgi:20S proteasome subunit alpha 7